MRTGFQRAGMRLTAGATIAGVIALGAAALLLSGPAVPGPGGATYGASSSSPEADGDEAPSSHAAPEPRGAAASTRVLMRNVDFYVDSQIVLHIRHLRATMHGREGHPVVFDDKNSFTFRLAWAEVALRATDLSALLNRYVFAVEGAPLRRLTIRSMGSELEQAGQMKKGLWIPFRIRAKVQATPDGRIRLHPTRVSVVGIPARRVLGWLGIELEDLLSTDRVRGVTIDGDDLLLDPTQLLPPPHIEGRVSAVRIEGDELVQVFGSEAAADSLGALRAPLSPNGNYMFYRGGTLRFGKLTMTDADLQILDLDPRDPFRFFIDRYAEQLVAGYSRTLPDLGLAAYMKDVDELTTPPRRNRRPVRD